MTTASEIVARNRGDISSLFYHYGIDEPVTVDTVQLAISEEPDFVYDLVDVIGTENIVYDALIGLNGSQRDVDSSERTAEEKAELATGIMSSLFSAGMGIWGNVNGAKNNTSLEAEAPKSKDKTKEKDNNKTFIYLTVGVVLLIVLVLIVFLMRNK